LTPGGFGGSIRDMKLTNEDFKAFKDLVEVTLDEKIEEKGLVTRADISHLPTKDEFYAETAKLYKKMEDIEEALDIVNDRSSENRDRIEDLEEIHPGGRHAIAA